MSIGVGLAIFGYRVVGIWSVSTYLKRQRFYGHGHRFRQDRLWDRSDRSV